MFVLFGVENPLVLDLVEDEEKSMFQNISNQLKWSVKWIVEKRRQFEDRAALVVLTTALDEESHEHQHR